ncbi:MAG: hypothetical protein Alis3KO_17760 [Aliiglaciecola sp.]
MRIGELASKSGVPTSTIRFYEQKGLMPEVPRRASGYRIYDNDALDRLQLIKFSQSLGFSLDELPKLIDSEGGCDHEQLMNRLIQKRAETATLIEQLQTQQLHLSILIDKLEDTWKQEQCLPQSELANILNQTKYQ